VAGYSNTPLPKKLGIKAGHRVALVNPPTGFAKTPGALPEKAVIQIGHRVRAHAPFGLRACLEWQRAAPGDLRGAARVGRGIRSAGMRPR
jgi:hypothetical protein